VNKATAHNALLKKLLIICILMFGFGFALVPLYDVFCRYTGINGKTSQVAATAAKKVDLTRSIRVEFLTTTDGAMPWGFVPEITSINLHPGEVKVVNFLAENVTDYAQVGQAVPSVSPGQAAQFFKKIECFCFTQQPLAAHEKKAMPVQFYIDTDLPEQFTTITLSYRLYLVANVVSQN
jgi:cytochrome c oxidase assembly protein subunit 11